MDTLHQIIDTEGEVSPFKGNFYVSSLNSSSNVYCTFYNTQLDQAWDENASAMGPGATVTHANAAVPCTDHRAVTGNRVANGYLVPVPDTLTDGWYKVAFYANATPASADEILLSRYCYIKGGRIQSVDDL